MAQKSANPLLSIADNFGYHAKRSVAYVAGKLHIEALCAVTGALAGNAAALLGITALITGFSAALAEMDYRNRRNQLLEDYGDEMAAQLGKPRRYLSDEDLDVAAYGDKARGIKGNETLREAIEQGKNHRTYGIVLSTIASLAALGVVTALAVAGGPLAGGEGLMLLAAKGLTGLATYHALKVPLHHIAVKNFGMDDHTVNDQIIHIKRQRELGREITPEEVMDVFVQANQKLGIYIKENFGKDFPALNAIEKAHLVKEFEPSLRLENITRQINEGLIRTSELAYAAHGEFSGHIPDYEKTASRPNLITRFAARCEDGISQLSQKLRGHKHGHEQKEDGPVLNNPVRVQHDHPVFSYYEGQGDHDFVGRLGLAARKSASSDLAQRFEEISRNGGIGRS